VKGICKTQLSDTKQENSDRKGWGAVSREKNREEGKCTLEKRTEGEGQKKIQVVKSDQQKPKLKRTAMQKKDRRRR